MLYNAPPMELGELLSGTDPNSSTTLINSDKLGQVYFFPAQNLDTGQTRGPKTRVTGQGITAVLLRNTSGAALYAKRLALLGEGYDSTHACYGHQQATGFCRVNDQRAVIVDPWLPSTGVPDNDIFWGILKGRCLVKTTYATMVAIAAGDPLFAGTINSTSGNSTGGGVAKAELANATDATLALAIPLHIIGWAITAKTTDNTNADILIEACIRHYG
jgi:hypothetical protein